MAINLLIYLVSKDVFPFVGLAFIAENLLFDCYSIYMYFNITAFTLLIDFLELGIICYHAISKHKFLYGASLRLRLGSKFGLK